MTTVCFVSYKVNSVDRRVGPMTLDHAEPLAKHLTRNHLVTDITLEEWALMKATPFLEEKKA